MTGGAVINHDDARVLSAAPSGAFQLTLNSGRTAAALCSPVNVFFFVKSNIRPIAAFVTDGHAYAIGF